MSLKQTLRDEGGNPHLWVKTFFEKDEAAENGGVDFGIGDIGTSAHLY